MESLLNRYRNITVLLLVIFGQLLLLAVQVKNDRDVRMIRIWTVMAITPVARVAESLRGGTIGVVRNYILLRDTNQENRRLKTEVDRLKLENIFLKNDLNTADRAKALQLLQAHIPSRAVAASIIGAAGGANSKVVFVDRGSTAGIERGMAVVTPEGIVGKVIASYPTASQVMLVTDPDFAAGVVSQKTLTRGTLKGQGTPMCRVDYVALEDKIQPGEMLFTSGDDRVFPRGFPVGVVKIVRNGPPPFKEIYVEPAGVQHGVEDVLILIEGVHQPVPEAAVASPSVYIAPPPPAPAGEAGGGSGGAPGGAGSGSGTEADKLRTQYKTIGDAQGHKFGEGAPGSKPPNFNMQLPPAGAAQTPAGGAQGGQAAPVTQQAPATAPNGSAVPVGQPAQRPAGAPGTQQPSGTAPSRPAAPAGQPAQRPGVPGTQQPSGTVPSRPAAPAGQPAQRPTGTPGTQQPSGTAPRRTVAPAGQPSGGAPKRQATPAGQPAQRPAGTQPPPSGAANPAPGDAAAQRSAVESRAAGMRLAIAASMPARGPFAQAGPER
jgi:rod shape-determining protein MreC